MRYVKYMGTGLGDHRESYLEGSTYGFGDMHVGILMCLLEEFIKIIRTIMETYFPLLL